MPFGTSLNEQRKAPVLGNHSQNSKKLQSAPVLYSRGWFCQGRINFPKRFHSCHYRKMIPGEEFDLTPLPKLPRLFESRSPISNLSESAPFTIFLTSHGSFYNGKGSLLLYI
jgi:hypothetical protein